MPTPDAPRRLPYRLPRRLPRRLAGLALPLLLALVALAGCGGSSSSPSTSSSALTIAGTWGGAITEPQMGTNSTLKVADVYLQLAQAGDGKVTGKATLCHGALGDHPLVGVAAQGEVTPPREITLRFAQFDFHGMAATTQTLTLPGTFAKSGGASAQTLAASLHPISASAFAAACASIATTPTP